MTYAYSDDVIFRPMVTYDTFFEIMKDVIMHKTLNKVLQIDPLVPLFKLRLHYILASSKL